VDSAHCSENSIEKLEKLSSSTLVNHQPHPTFWAGFKVFEQGCFRCCGFNLRLASCTGETKPHFPKKCQAKGCDPYTTFLIN